MKRGTPQHPKMTRLAKSLNINRAWAIGILESLWHWAGRFAPQGDIGRYEDQDIADAVYWTKEPGTLVGSLVASGWVELDAEHRLVIHDWDTHAEESVKKYLKRNNLPFVNVRRVVQTNAGHVQTLADIGSLPEPVPKPLPEPVPLPKPFDTPTVRKAFDEWFGYLVRRGKPIFDTDLAAVKATQFFNSAEDLVWSINFAISNNYLPLKDYTAERGNKQRPAVDSAITDEDLK